MKEMSRGRVCSLDVTRSFSYRKNCSLLSLARLLLDPVTHCSTSIRLSLSLLLREQSLDMRQKSQQDPNCPASAPQTQVCVCVCVCMRGVKAPCLHSCLGLGPSPCLPRPEARPVALAEPGERNTGGRGGGDQESRGLLHFSVVTLL